MYFYRYRELIETSETPLPCGAFNISDGTQNADESRRELRVVNCTPHPIVLNDGTTFEPSGSVARVSASFVEVEKGIYRQVFGDVIDLPEATEGTLYIVSAMVFNATDRQDVIAPATGHPETKRNEFGHIVSVPGFIIK
jgi:hypothetical protein